ncbi:hypothetical protein ACFW91_06500 [Streptomyces asoensis]|uniref:hypothetical protein n=1 Tax=Streptomyces asoensis TaxID=249586 RepID=UPI00367A929C
MPTLKVVDITPAALSGNASQDAEPNLAVNPEHPEEVVATAFTPDPMGGPFAPIYVSTDGGTTWSLRSIVPGADIDTGTGDITVGFAPRGGTLYTGILSGRHPHGVTRMQILRSPGISSTAPMEVLVTRDRPDQPWVVVGGVRLHDTTRDRVYVANNDLGKQPRTASVEVSDDARTAAAPAGFRPHVIDRRAPSGQDGPPVRIALHPDGTVYALFQSWQDITQAGGNALDVTFDVVVTRDDDGGVGPDPFQDLKDAEDSAIGQRVVTERTERFNALMGQERLGGDLAIAVDPTDAAGVWASWCDRAGGAAGVGCVLHVRRSSDHGQTWSADVRTVTNAKNPALAVTADSLVGLAYQQFKQEQWVTVLEVTADGWTTPAERRVLHQAPADVPPAGFLPYLGDYIRLLAVDRDLYGVFSGNNTPDPANFPEGVTYQRRADFVSHQLFDLDNVTRVAPSIDPFFFHRTV